MDISRTDKKISEYIAWISIAIIMFAAAGIRLRLVDVPLERDEDEYAYAGQLMLEGVALYTQAYNMKMPGIYAIARRCCLLEDCCSESAF